MHYSGPSSSSNAASWIIVGSKKSTPGSTQNLHAQHQSQGISLRNLAWAWQGEFASLLIEEKSQRNLWGFFLLHANAVYILRFGVRPSVRLRLSDIRPMRGRECLGFDCQFAWSPASKRDQESDGCAMLCPSNPATWGPARTWDMTAGWHAWVHIRIFISMC